MKACVIESFGGAEVMKIKEVPKPEPKPNEVLIKVVCASVNPVDWKIREGYLKSRVPHEFPIILGWDAAGVVESVGKDVHGFEGGDHVYAYCRKPVVKDGTFAEYVVVDARHVSHKPENLTMAQAASIPLTALTAWQSLFDFANVREGNTVMIHAGGGGVGSMAIQFAKNAKAKVITTASAKHHAYVKKLGADVIIDYTKDDFVEKVKEVAPKGVDFVYDTVGGGIAEKSLGLVKDGGSLVSIVELIDESFGARNKVKTGFVFVAPNGQELETIAKLIEEGKVVAPLIEEFVLDDAPEALEKNRAGHTQGKIVIHVARN
jgi:NADPH2:quinone reductase